MKNWITLVTLASLLTVIFFSGCESKKVEEKHVEKEVTYLNEEKAIAYFRNGYMLECDNGEGKMVIISNKTNWIMRIGDSYLFTTDYNPDRIAPANSCVLLTPQ